jgi:hypothetical protein
VEFGIKLLIVLINKIHLPMGSLVACNKSFVLVLGHLAHEGLKFIILLPMLPSAEIAGMCHQPAKVFYKKVKMTLYRHI